MPATSTQQEIEELQRRLNRLRDQAEDELRQKLAAARKVVEELERQLSEITGRPSASAIKAMTVEKGTRTRRPSISDEELKAQILATVSAAGGINAKKIAESINQAPARIRQFIAANAGALKRVGNGPGTKFFMP
jgi:predicted RNase H-like nuclease (RuvC/YqgF family)